MMVEIKHNAYVSESSSHLMHNRRNELKKQYWTRAKSQSLADEEGLTLSDAHWSVLTFLRKDYLESGLPRHSRYLSKSLNRVFATQGGNKYLHKLFPNGPVSQGCRIANLPIPPDATDTSYGFCY